MLKCVRQQNIFSIILLYVNNLLNCMFLELGCTGNSQFNYKGIKKTIPILISLEVRCKITG